MIVLQHSAALQQMLPALASAPFLLSRAYGTMPIQQLRNAAVPPPALVQQATGVSSMSKPFRIAPLTPISRGFATQSYRGKYGQQDFTQVIDG
jgi:hypothetical protein